jgi:glycerol-3-phosphate cytidylyltransferase
MIIGFTCSAFDLLHPGHLAMLEECKEYCDHLIVGLHTDPSIDRPGVKNKPVQSTFERYIQLNSCKFVDQIIPYDTEKDLKNLLATIKINIRFIGYEYIDKDYTGKDICFSRGIDIFYNESRLHSFSSSEMRNRLK